MTDIILVHSSHEIPPTKTSRESVKLFSEHKKKLEMTLPGHAVSTLSTYKYTDGD